MRRSVFIHPFAGLLCLSLAMFAQGPQGPESPDDALLATARQKVMDTVHRLPKYMCTLNIDRQQYESTSVRGARSCDDLAAERKADRQTLRLASSDRLRLDVAIGAIEELYSWSGANRFDDRDLGRLVDFGATSTGGFSGFLRDIFGGADQARFFYDGDVTFGGKTVSEFGFQVPFDTSHYQVRSGVVWVTAGYSGTFLVELKTGDLVQLTINSDELPEDTGTCEVSHTLDYERVRLTDAEFLLPAQTLLRFTDRNGAEQDSRAVYSRCHEFRGESALNFDEAPEAVLAGPGRAPTAPPVAIPPGLPFKLALTQSVDTATAAAGDPISAKLTTDIRDKSSKILMRAGTAVTGRIVKMLFRYDAGQPTLALSIKLESLHAVAAPLVSTTFEKKGNLVKRLEILPLDLPDDEGVNPLTFRNAKPGYVVPSGVESSWRTSAP